MRQGVLVTWRPLRSGGEAGKTGEGAPGETAVLAQSQESCTHPPHRGRPSSTSAHSPTGSVGTWAQGGSCNPGSFTALLLPRPLRSGCLWAPPLSHFLRFHPSACCCLPTAFLNVPHSLLPGPGPSCLCLPLHGGGSPPSASSPWRGLRTPGCSLVSPWQGERGLGSLHPLAWLLQDRRCGNGGTALSPPRLPGSQEPGVGSSSGPCPMAGPAQQGGRGRAVSSWGHIGAPIWVTLHRGECH